MDLEVDTVDQSWTSNETKSIDTFDSHSLDFEDGTKAQESDDFQDEKPPLLDNMEDLKITLHVENQVKNLPFLEEKLENLAKEGDADDKKSEISENLEEGAWNGHFEDEPKVEAQNDELPEGWVRSGKGLMAEFRNSPKNPEDDSFEAKNLLINFTNNDGRIKSQKSLCNALMSLDRSAVKELKGGLVAIRASKPQNPKSQPNCRDRYSVKNSKLVNDRVYNSESNKAAKAHLACSGDNFYSNYPDSVNCHHKRELEQAKQTILCHVEELVRKYRELAVDAVNAARNEQKKCEAECKKAYSTAYNACLKYEKDLKNTVKFALKKYQNSIQDSYHPPYSQTNSDPRASAQPGQNPKDLTDFSHKLLRQDLCFDYQVDQHLLIDFESKVLNQFDSFLTQLSSRLEDSFNFSRDDSLEFLRSLISTRLS